MTNCNVCNNKVNNLTSHRLGDGTILCNKCFSEIPKYFRKDALMTWSECMYHSFIAYRSLNQKYSGTITDKFKGISFGKDSGVFSLPGYEDSTVYKLTDVDEMLFNVSHTEIQKGLVKPYITGDITFETRLVNLGLTIKVVIAKKIKLITDYDKQTNTYTYDLPDEYQIFMGRISCAKQKADFLKQKSADHDCSSHERKTFENEHQAKQDKKKIQPDLRDALTLFMMNESELSPESIRSQRNRLLKTYHPDEGGENRFSEKINAAYDILSQYIKSIHSGNSP